MCRLRLRLRLAATQRPSTSARSAPVTLTPSPPSAPTAHPPLWRSSVPPRPPSSRPRFHHHTEGGPQVTLSVCGVPSPSGGSRGTFLSSRPPSSIPRGSRVDQGTHWTRRHQLDLLPIRAPKGRDARTGLAQSMWEELCLRCMGDLQAPAVNFVSKGACNAFSLGCPWS